MNVALHPDLFAALQPGNGLRHRFANEPFFESFAQSADYVARINAGFEWKVKETDAARAAGDWHNFVFLHERPWRLEALMDAFLAAGREVPQQLIADVWRDSESVRWNLDDWRIVWGDYAGTDVMTDAERRALRRMPKMLTVYRGVSHPDAVEGMSWTLDRTKAEWFARRNSYGGAPALLATGRVKKVDVIAYFTGRKEREIVAYPEDVERVDLTMLSSDLREAA